MELKFNIKSNKDTIRKNLEKELDNYSWPENISKEEVLEAGVNNVFSNEVICEVNEALLNNKDFGFDKVVDNEKFCYYIKKPDIRLSRNPFEEMQVIMHNKIANTLHYYQVDKDVIFISHLIANNNYNKIKLGTLDNLNNEQKLLLNDLYLKGVIKYNEKGDTSVVNCKVKNMGDMVKLYPNINLTMITSINITDNAKKGIDAMEEWETLTYFKSVYSINEGTFLDVQTFNITKELIRVFANYYKEVLENTKELKEKQELSINAIDLQIAQLKEMIRTLEKQKEEITNVNIDDLKKGGN